ncbi:multidrug-efflux transporter 1 regulator [Oxobacter pfennigii]|uniref:Multidrug-efflux transporter 1 regulator n=1 Tax=Oxobacter pfennigii TaxID=36849 RepID=A0A0N8NTZ4_9CLOT|nr:MerR family transcriptional regulator [Oxobacter pfennigii]KPU46200.1 multidrug-efflux transporter 1 regulator [Oxobacter pfennigii]
MDNWVNDRLTISEVAELHNIPVKTLRYWDEIGLFPPNVKDKKSGYRYYSTRQFPRLNLIKQLKIIGVSSKEIIEKYKDADLSGFSNQLENHKETLNYKIKELIKMRKFLNMYISDFKKAASINELEKVKYTEYQSRQIIRVNMDIKSRVDYQIALKKLEEISQVKNILLQKAVLSMSKSDFQQRIYDRYNGAYIWVNDFNSKDKSVMTTQPRGTYAEIFFNDSRSSSFKYFDMLLDHIEKDGFIADSDTSIQGVANIMNNTVSGGYLTKFSVAVKKK